MLISLFNKHILEVNYTFGNNLFSNGWSQDTNPGWFLVITPKTSFFKKTDNELLKDKVHE